MYENIYSRAYGPVESYEMYTNKYSVVACHSGESADQKEEHAKVLERCRSRCLKACPATPTRRQTVRSTRRAHDARSAAISDTTPRIFCFIEDVCMWGFLFHKENK